MRHVLFCLTLFTSSAVFCNPTNPTVVTGDIDIDFSQTSFVEITSQTDRSIIDWGTFSIDSGEQVNFTLPSSTSAILNRVRGAVASEIAGNLTSNGTVYLVNEAGILVTNAGTINTNNFIGAALDVLNDDFLSGGPTTFQTLGHGTVQNNGAIITAGGTIILMGFCVDNQGSLTAAEGGVGLGAGTNIIMNPGNGIILRVIEQAPQMNMLTGVSNTGSINAIQAELKADGNLYALAINHSGYINATGTMNHNGRVVLIAKNGPTYVDGSISASSAYSTGGVVHVLGKEVTLDDSCFIDATGNQGGGTVLIGGSFQNTQPEIETSDNTLFKPGALIIADALSAGTGGDVVVWANDTTNFYGTIYSRGGSMSGDGGSVEVSGLNYLNFAGLVDNSAANGMPGQLLLDPIILENKAWESN